MSQGEIKLVQTNNITDKRFLYKFNAQLIYNFANCINFIRISIASLNRKSVKEIANGINDEIVRLPSHFKYIQWYFPSFDNINPKQHKLELPKVTKPGPIF